MRLSLLSLELATGETLSEEARHRMRGCFAALRGAPTVLNPLLTADEAGLVIAAALMGGDPGEAVTLVRGAALMALNLEGGGETVTLPPDSVGGHPLFGPWVPQSLPAAIATALMAGATFTILAPGAPAFECLELTPTGGALVARLVLKFRPTANHWVTASAAYGEAADVGAGSVIRVPGQSLIDLGVFARTLTQTGGDPEEAAREVLTASGARTPFDTVH